MEERAQAIVIRNQKMLFAYGMIRNELRHSFIGGRIESGETASEAVLRELKEEANVTGQIIFKFAQEIRANHQTFLVDIDLAEVTLGNDPEESTLQPNERSLQDLLWLDLRDKHLFTDIDKEYLSLLRDECNRTDYSSSWLSLVAEIIKN